MENLLYVVIGLLVLVIILLVVLLLRKNKDEELARQVLACRQEVESNRKQLKEQLQGDQQSLVNLLQGGQQSLKLEVLQQLKVMSSSTGEATERMGKSTLDTLNSLNGQLSQAMGQRLSAMESRMQALEKTNEDRMGNMSQQLVGSVGMVKTETKEHLGEIRSAVDEKLQDMTQRLESLQKNNEEKLERLREANENKLEHMRTVLEQGMQKMQADNDKKLEDIRVTVGEKLQSTLEERLKASFQKVDDNLTRVYESVGQMKELANEVGSLKTIIGNVKLRGNFGEAQLSGILEQMLVPEQYEVNVATIPGSNDKVEFALKVPHGEEGFIYMPIDAKFPADLYNHLQEAKEKGDKNAIKESYKALKSKVLADAKYIQSKYVQSPHTTDYGILFLPFEGLYAEVLSIPGLLDEVQYKHRIIIAGPTNMVAIISVLQMSFRSMALQKRTTEVWTTLEAVKTEFARFGDAMVSMRKNLDKTSKNLDDMMGARTKAINKSLSKVETIELNKAEALLEIENEVEE